MSKIKVTFAPTAFDDVDMTQEELDELISEIERMVEDGSIFDHAEPLSEEEITELERELNQRDERKMQ